MLGQVGEATKTSRRRAEKNDTPQGLLFLCLKRGPENDKYIYDWCEFN